MMGKDGGLAENEELDPILSGSITKELLQQSRKEIESELHGGAGQEDVDVLSDLENMTEDEISNAFDVLYTQDTELRKLLGEHPERYTVPEKASILQAYKKGGGVAGLAEIIDSGDEGECEEMDIDLDNPEDAKVVEDEFKKLYADPNFSRLIGEEALELDALQKYQILEAYNKNGIEGVMMLMQGSAGAEQRSPTDGGSPGKEEDDEELLYKNGKAYSRVQIEDMPDPEYLMDTQTGDIYNVNFELVATGDEVEA